MTGSVAISHAMKLMTWRFRIEAFNDVDALLKHFKHLRG